VTLRPRRQARKSYGDVLTAISDGLVSLLKEFYGHGPSQAKSYYADDLVVCVLRGGFSRVEQTLLDGGRGPAVIQQRMEFQDLMRERFEEIIENATGRPVIGFMSGNQQHPDMMCEVFILAPTDLLDDDEIVHRPADSNLAGNQDRLDRAQQAIEARDVTRGNTRGKLSRGSAPVISLVAGSVS
jgi:uncharacterized protein YbcI